MKKIIFATLLLLIMASESKAIFFGTSYKIINRNADSIFLECSASFQFGFGGQVEWLRGFAISTQNDTVYLDLYYSLLGNATGMFFAYCNDSVAVKPIPAIANYLTIRSYWYYTNPMDTVHNFNYDTTIFLTPLQTSEPSKEPIVEIWPNPVRDHLLINTVDENHTVSIYNLFGMLIKKEKGKKNIDVSELCKGTYIFIIKSDNGNRCCKFVKE
ncbi:MAG: T9SS type A sorting domain-containing protein [Bacteroidetes bacterium]|nr:T9SS type A sorting domain-containing protein [Bacteroidota bacterium]MBK8145564.1 T9SS type A sorting domain-containing protein [Bacteroidota bacterium]